MTPTARRLLGIIRVILEIIEFITAPLGLLASLFPELFLFITWTDETESSNHFTRQ